MRGGVVDQQIGHDGIQIALHVQMLRTGKDQRVAGRCKPRPAAHRGRLGMRKAPAATSVVPSRAGSDGPARCECPAGGAEAAGWPYPGSTAAKTSSAPTWRAAVGGWGIRRPMGRSKSPDHDPGRCHAAELRRKPKGMGVSQATARSTANMAEDGIEDEAQFVLRFGPKHATVRRLHGDIGIDCIPPSDRRPAEIGCVITAFAGNYRCRRRAIICTSCSAPRNRRPGSSGQCR